MQAPPMSPLALETYQALTQIVHEAGQKGKYFRCSELDEILRGVQVLTCLDAMTSEEQMAISIAISANESFVTRYSLSHSELCKDFRCIRIKTRATEPISQNTSWESILCSVEFSFTYAHKTATDYQNDDKDNDYSTKDKKKSWKDVVASV